MKVGKILIVVGAIITLFSTFVLSFARTNGIDGRIFSSGIGFLLNLPDIFGNVAYWIGLNGGDVALEYIMSIIFIIFVFSGVIQLLGLLNKYVGFVGSLLAIAFGITLIIFVAVDISGWGLNRYSSLFWAPPIVSGAYPLDVPVMTASGVFYQNLQLGTITLIVGGGVGLTGGILTLKDI
ncbi:MAG: hypothetical protein ACFE9S_01930 [Candidatus Hermodarchaeota archaeon]